MSLGNVRVPSQAMALESLAKPVTPGSWGSTSTRGAELAATSSKICVSAVPVQIHKKLSRLAVQACLWCLHLGKPSLMLTGDLTQKHRSTNLRLPVGKVFQRGRQCCHVGLWTWTMIICLFAFQRSNISTAMAFESLSNSKKSFQASSWTTRLWFPSVPSFGLLVWSPLVVLSQMDDRPQKWIKILGHFSLVLNASS